MPVCPECKGEGETEQRSAFHRGLHGLMRYPNEVTEKLAGRKPDSMMGHDTMDAYAAGDKILELVGLPRDWGLCQRCKGEGEIEEGEA